MAPLCSSRTPVSDLRSHPGSVAALLFFTIALCCQAATLPSPSQIPPGPPTPSAAPGMMPSASGPPHPQGVLLELEQPPKEKAVAGEDVLFSCLLKGGEGGAMEQAQVHWEHQGVDERRNVLEGNQTSGGAFAGRVFLSGDLLAGDLSMTLRNVSLADRGVYICRLTPLNGSTLTGGGTKLSILSNPGLFMESIGTITAVVVAAVVVVVGLVALTLTQFKDKLPCLKK